MEDWVPVLIALILPVFDKARDWVALSVGETNFSLQLVCGPLFKELERESLTSFQVKGLIDKA